MIGPVPVPRGRRRSIGQAKRSKQKEIDAQLLVVANNWTGGDGPRRTAINLLARISLRERFSQAVLIFAMQFLSRRNPDVDENPRRKTRRGGKTQWADVHALSYAEVWSASYALTLE